MDARPQSALRTVGRQISEDKPFAERLITRTQMERVIRNGLERTRGSYRKMLPLLRMPDSDYKRFMDFLRRHHCIIDFREYRKK